MHAKNNRHKIHRAETERHWIKGTIIRHCLQNIKQNQYKTETSKMKERIKYIDALRGFTMLLVVFAHIELLGFGISPYSSTLGGIFVSFRMPMFFFISGYIAYKAITWDFGTYIKSVRKKAIVQLIPTIFFFSLFTFSHMPEAGRRYYKTAGEDIGLQSFCLSFFLFTIQYVISQNSLTSGLYWSAFWG